MRLKYEAEVFQWMHRLFCSCKYLPSWTTIPEKLVFPRSSSLFWPHGAFHSTYPLHAAVAWSSQTIIAAESARLMSDLID